MVKKEVEVLEGRVVQLGGWGAEGAKEVEGEVEEARKKLRSLEVQSRVNLPVVRWRVANAMGSSSFLFLWFTRSGLLITVEVDMTKPVHRHLVEQRWRSDGDLDLLVSLPPLFGGKRRYSFLLDGAATPNESDTRRNS